MNESSHRAGDHKGRPAPAPRRWTSFLLAILVVVAGLTLSAPASIADPSSEATQPTGSRSPSGSEDTDKAEIASPEKKPSDGPAPEDEKPSEERARDMGGHLISGEAGTSHDTTRQLL